MTNPLLQDHALPAFKAIKPEHIVPAVEALIGEAKAVIDRVTAPDNLDATWSGLVAPIDAASERLNHAFSPVGHLKAVMDTPELRDAYNQCLPHLSAFGTWVGQHKPLYQAYKTLKASAEYAALDGPRQRVIDDAIRDFELAGVGLTGDAKARYGAIKSELSDLSSAFSDAVLDASQAWTLHLTDAARLDGMPESILGMMAQLAEARELEGYLVTLDAPVVMTLLSFAKDRELRREVYTAWTTRASDQGPCAGQYDNSGRIESILALRHELSELLGFNNYAERSLATKMANSTEQVIEFLTDLADKARPFAEAEVAELRQFAREQGVDPMEPWDASFYSERLKERDFDLDQEALRPWFPLPQVLKGLFSITGELFNFRVEREKEVELWHDEASFWRILRGEETLGFFYLDVYAREGKRGGAWMDVCRSRWREPDSILQLPVAYLTCNFTRPVGDQPALLTHDEVVTLFHEFGHGLHHMLTQQEALGVSGIAGVPWDAVELPSQFLENWCFQPEGLARMSGHVDSGEPLPKAELDKLIAARGFQAGMQTLRQVEFSLFDFELHAHYNPAAPKPFMDVLRGVRERVAVMEAPSFGRFPCAFSHIFAGGYAAGYYSYKWAEVLSADAFSRFEEEGVMSTEVGRSFAENILERGGSDDPMSLFIAFRGRKPTVDALLRHNGLAA
ncbi:MAG: M3 family metallopeptidase [Litorivicinus sp.]